MRKQTIFVLALMATGVFLTNTGFAEILQYEIIDLGTLGGSLSAANGINDAGQVVGYSRTASHTEHAFLWDDGEMIDLGTLPGPSYSEARSINNAGQVVGFSGSDDGSAFIWDSSGGMRYLDGIGDTESEARDINNSGQVVGWTSSSAFLWDSTSGVTDLGSGSALGINDAGQVVGNSYSHAFLWEDGEMLDLGTLGGNVSVAYAINDFGQVVGYADLASWDEHAFLWEDEEMIDLGTLGGSDSVAYAINDAGQIVGHSYPVHASDDHSGGFLWDSENGMIKLSDLLFDDSGWDRLPYAMDINNYGQIVGWGSIDGETHAFLMTPVPEPATLLLVALGSLALLRKRKP